MATLLMAAPAWPQKPGATPPPFPIRSGDLLGLIDREGRTVHQARRALRPEERGRLIGRAGQGVREAAGTTGAAGAACDAGGEGAVGTITPGASGISSLTWTPVT